MRFKIGYLLILISFLYLVFPVSAQTRNNRRRYCMNTSSGISRPATGSISGRNRGNCASSSQPVCRVRRENRCVEYYDENNNSSSSSSDSPSRTRVRRRR